MIPEYDKLGTRKCKVCRPKSSSWLLNLSVLSLKDELIFVLIFIHLIFCRLIRSDAAFERARGGYSLAYIGAALKYPGTPPVHVALERMFRIFSVIAGKRRCNRYAKEDRRNRGICGEEAGFDGVVRKDDIVKVN